MGNLGATYLAGGLDIQSAVIVETTASATTNGVNLLAAYTAAKALTPNGAALSATNRASVIVPPGKYSLDNGADSAVPSGVTVTPDAVGENTLTFYYRLVYSKTDNSLRSLITNEATFTIGDSTTEIIVAGGDIPYWADNMMVLVGTTSGNLPYGATITTFSSDILGEYPDLELGDLYAVYSAIPAFKAFTALTLDTQFVDIIGLTTDRSLQHIYGTPPATNSGVIIQTANDVHISNLTVEILTAYGTPELISTDSAAYFPSTNLNNTVIENVYFKGEEGSETVLWSMRVSIEYSGIFTNCKGEDCAFGGSAGTASGTFTNCFSGDYSFGDGGIASGTFNNCTGGVSAFGGYGIASGTFNNCTGEDCAFGGYGGTASGTFSYCTAGVYSFGDSEG
ncbi:MAG: hypothetical protein M0Q91_11900 [Methanoregula sp.]|nr:hypothetical protein [Methanoregula sp.]